LLVHKLEFSYKGFEKSYSIDYEECPDMFIISMGLL